MAESDSKKVRTVVLPIDNSEHSERAFHWYVDVDMKDGDKMFFAHFFVPPPLPAMSLYHAAVKATDEYHESLQHHLDNAKKLMKKFEEKCEKAGVKYETHLESCQDSIGADIIKVSKHVNADFIVIGSRGLSQVRRTILGSVSEYVVHHSRIPVIIVPPEQPINPF
ncbi:putative universal stress protein SAUSA300_1656 isoform X2 [Rhopilema esculentum]|uniref:putative universal stress protein SAUSA300_1656 isoform X2 n=1 Tax=Rhopilema esculentum TaxID=499914 RepID=UPI0031DD6D5D